MKPWYRGTGILFLLGAVVLSIFDGFHTYSGTTSYPDPLVFRMAWWVPLEFGLVTAAGGLFYARVYRALGAARQPSPVAVALACVIFGAAYYASAYLPASNAIKGAVLLAAFALAWLAADRTWQGVVLSLFAAACGCTTEIVLSHAGRFSHLQPDRWGIPLWLPFLYLVSGPAIGQLARKLLDESDAKRAR